MWLIDLLEKGRVEKAATRRKGKEEAREAQRKAKEAQQKAELEAHSRANGFNGGQCDKCGESFYNLATHTAKACTDRQKRPRRAPKSIINHQDFVGY